MHEKCNENVIFCDKKRETFKKSFRKPKKPTFLKRKIAFYKGIDLILKKIIIYIVSIL